MVTTSRICRCSTPNIGVTRISWSQIGSRDIHRSDGYFNVVIKTQLIIFCYPAFVNSRQPVEPGNVKADSKLIEIEYVIRAWNLHGFS